MFGEITVWLLELIKTHGLLAVVIGVMIETIIVPLPSPLIIMTAGYLLIPQGSFASMLSTALTISVVAGIAQTFGSYLLYFIGYYGGKPIIDRFDRYIGVSWKDVQAMQKKFNRARKEELTILFLRALPIIPLSVISGVAGVLKIEFKKYGLFTFLGTIPRNFMLALCGFFFSSFYSMIAEKIDHAETAMTVILILMILGYVAAKKAGLIERVRKHILR